MYDLEYLYDTEMFLNGFCVGIKYKTYSRYFRYQLLSNVSIYLFNFLPSNVYEYLLLNFNGVLLNTCIYSLKIEASKYKNNFIETRYDYFCNLHLVIIQRRKYYCLSVFPNQNQCAY